MGFLDKLFYNLGKAMRPALLKANPEKMGELGRHKLKMDFMFADHRHFIGEGEEEVKKTNFKRNRNYHYIVDDNGDVLRCRKPKGSVSSPGYDNELKTTLKTIEKLDTIDPPEPGWKYFVHKGGSKDGDIYRMKEK